MVSGNAQNMKIFVRMLTLLLALLMLGMTVVACKEEVKEGGGGSQEVDEYGREGDDLPELNYMGQKITTLYWEDVENLEFDIEQITSDNVSNALYDRNGEIERRLNVELDWVGEKGNANNMDNFVAAVERDKKSQTKAYDLIASYSRTEGMLAVRGYLVDMNDIGESHINLEKPWWPAELVETVTIGDSMYFISGDIAPSVLYLMQGLCFNKSMLNEEWNTYAQSDEGGNFESDRDEKGKEIASPACRMVYQWAYDGTWTLDKLIMLTMGTDNKGVGNIAGGEVANAKDKGDSYGFVSINYQIETFYTGCNLRLVEPTTDGSVLKISDDFGSSKTVKLVNKLSDWFKEDTCFTDTTLGGERDYSTPFNAGRAMFLAVRVRHLGSLNVDWDAGILPMPKWDEKQTNYYTAMGYPFTLFGIYNGLDDLGDREATYTMLTAVLECWASESYRLVTPEVFEVNMQLKYAETQYETDMFEIIRSSVVFDLGRVFNADLSGMSTLPGTAAVKHASWSTTYGAYKKSLNKKLATIVANL